MLFLKCQEGHGDVVEIRKIQDNQGDLVHRLQFCYYWIKSKFWVKHVLNLNFK